MTPRITRSVLALTALLVAAAAVAQETGRYEDTEQGFSIAFPKDWERRDQGPLILALSPKANDEDPFRENVSIRPVALAPGVSLKAIFDASVTALKKRFGNIRDDQQGDMTLAGVPAKWYLFTHERNALTIRQKMYFVVANNRLYLVTGSAAADRFNAHAATFEAFAASLKLMTPVVPKLKTFESKPHGFSITFPGAWEVRKGRRTVVIAVSPPENADDRVRENANVSVQTFDRERTLEEYADGNLKGLIRAFKDFKEVERGDARLGDVDAKWVIGTRTMGEMTLQHLSYACVKGKRGYALTFTATPDTFDAHRATFEQIAQSLKLD